MKKMIIILGVLGTSFSAIFVRYADAPSTVLVFYRMLFAVLFLLPGVAAGRRELAGLGKRDILLCVISGIFLGLHFTFYFLSLQYTSITSSVVLVDTEVFFVALGGVLFLREKLSPLAWASIVITFAGSVIVALGDMQGSGLLGDVLALGGALCSAVYTLIGRKCRARMSTTGYTWVVYLFAGVVTLMASLFQSPGALNCGGKNLLAALGMTVLCTLLGHSIYSWGLKYEKASFISTVKLLEPIFATILGILAFQEIPGVTSVIGGLVIIAGIGMCIQSNS